MISMLKKKITGLVEIVISLKNRKKKQRKKKGKKKKQKKQQNKTKRKNWILHTAYVRHNMIAN